MMKKLDGMNYYELLYLDEDATGEDIEKAYDLALYSFSEESIATHSLLSEEEKIKMLDRVKTAFHTLNDEKKRANYDKNILRKTFLGMSQPESVEEKPRPEIPLEDKKVADKGLNFTGGKYLKHIREIKGLSLGDIAKKTMIRANYLVAIEEERIEDIPALVFVKSYIKAYAQHIGLDPEETLNKFNLSKPEDAKKDSRAKPLLEIWGRILAGFRIITFTNKEKIV